ncbi:MAG: hypothetical protein ABFS32_08340, partial [Bacteroidota bacterium]
KLAEIALMPGIIIANYQKSTEEVTIPNNDLIRKFLGNPDTQIDCPTPAQTIIFSKHRRRVPNWYSLDVPVMLGARKDSQDHLFEKAASQKYFLDHLPELANNVISEFNSVFETSIQTISNHNKSGAHVIITIDKEVITLFNENTGNYKDVQLISPTLLSPFPDSELYNLTEGKKSVTVLESASTPGADNSILFSVVQKSLGESNPKLYRGLHNTGLSESNLSKTISKITSGEAKPEQYIGFDFTRKSSEFPTHEVMLQEIDDKYPQLTGISINDQDKKELSPDAEDVPLSLRLYSDKGPAFSRLSRFYNNTAVFYNQQKEELVADPFNAIPIVPPCTAEMFSFTGDRKFIPEIEIKNCSGKGKSIMLCPHSALLPVVISVEELIKTGVSLATGKGVTFTQMTPLTKNLAKVSSGVIKTNTIEKANDFLPEAFEKLTSQLQLPEDKKAAANEELEAILAEIGEFPIARTKVFFDEPNAIEPGSGELFSVVVNPKTCTGCSICIHTEDAITMAPQTAESLSKAKENYNIWQSMPDTTAKTINRLIHDESYDSLVALSLGRNYLLSMSGGNKNQSNNPQKTVLHLLTTTIESVSQSRVIKQSEILNNLINSLSDQVHSELSQLLPKENLDSLSKSLKRTGSKKLSLREVIDQIPEKEQKLIDSVDLERRTGLVDDLKKLKDVLLNGPTGQGRSRFSLILSGKSMLQWAANYPVNHFNVPVIVDWDDAAPDQVLGLFHGQMRYVLDNIKLLRRAELEISNKYDPDIHDTEIVSLNWEDLSEEEKALFPPILLVAEWNDLNSTGWGNLNSLLATSFPVKVVIFESLTAGKQSAIKDYNKIASGILSAIALRKPFVFQGGIADTRHLFNGLRDGVERSGTALINLYHTDFFDHGIINTAWQSYAQLALNSRSFPALSYNPAKGESIYGSVNLEGNTNPKDDWIEEKVIIDDVEKEYRVTWADWAFTQPEWRKEFVRIEPGDANIMIADYLDLDDGARGGKNPVITRDSDEGLVYYSVSDAVIKMTETVLENWRTLQEMSGVKAQIPAKLKQELSFELEKAKANEIANLKQDHEQVIKDIEANQAETLRQQLKDKLVSLAKSARKNS